MSRLEAHPVDEPGVVVRVTRRLTGWLGPDHRRTDEVEGDIAEEIAFHLASHADDLQAAGESPTRAQALAEERFGDRSAIERECRRIQLGGRAMLQTVPFLVIAILLLALVVLGVGYVSATRERAIAVEAAMVSREQARDDAQRAQALLQQHQALLAATALVAPDEIDARQAASVDAQPSARERTLDEWRARFEEDPTSWRHGLRIAREVAELPPDEALAVMDALWPDLSVAHREQALKPFVFGDGHPHVLKLLHLAATDETLSVQARAFTYLRDYALADFSEDHEAYLTWAATYGELPPGEAIAGSAVDLVTRLRAVPLDELADELDRLAGIDGQRAAAAGLDLAAVLREAGAVGLLDQWLAHGDVELMRHALAWSRTIEPDEAWLRSHVVGLVADGGDDQLIGAACAALGRPGASWARAPLEDFLATRILDWGERAPQPGGVDGAVLSAVDALVAIGDPAAIPQMIAMIAADDSGAAVYNVGHFGLAKFTGVSYHESHDANWWRTWWERNQERLPPEVRGLAVPDLRARR